MTMLSTRRLLTSAAAVPAAAHEGRLALIFESA